MISLCGVSSKRKIYRDSFTEDDDEGAHDWPGGAKTPREHIVVGLMKIIG